MTTIGSCREDVDMVEQVPLLKLYQSMLLIRRTEEAIARHYAEGKMRCPTHLSIGQEAVAAGVCEALSTEDTVFSTHRAHAHYLAKGGDLNGMLAEIHGKSTGCAKGRGGSMHLIDLSVGFLGSTAIVGNSIPLAAGSALSHKLRNTGHIACCFFGDGSTEEGAFYETLNFASVRQLPVLFICENNLYSVYTPLQDRQPENRSVVQISEALGVRALSTDGNDVGEVYRNTNAAVKTIRHDGGPHLIEFMTYRWLEHCGPNSDQHLGYRPESEFQVWMRKDPLARLEKKLIDDGISTKDDLNIQDDVIKRQIDFGMEKAANDPFPSKETLSDGVYKTADHPWTYLS